MLQMLYLRIVQKSATLNTKRPQLPHLPPLLLLASLLVIASVGGCQGASGGVRISGGTTGMFSTAAATTTTMMQRQIAFVPLMKRGSKLCQPQRQWSHVRPMPTNDHMSIPTTRCMHCYRHCGIRHRTVGHQCSSHVTTRLFSSRPSKRIPPSSTASDGWYGDDVVSSTKSNTVKRIQALLKKRKKRLEQGQTIVEGPRMVFDLLESSRTSHLIRSVLVSTQEYDVYADRLHGALDADGADIHLQVGTPEVLKACSDTMTPQGILAVVDIPVLEIHDSRAEAAASSGGNPLYLILDGVGDPGNVGTLLRSSFAVGVAGVILMPGACDVWNPKALRSSMGAAFQVPIIETDGWESTLATLEDLNVDAVYGATMMTADDGSQGSKPYFDLDWGCGPIGLIIGSEGTGLCEEIRSALAASGGSDAAGDGDMPVEIKAVHVPMKPGIESLNAAVCGSVMLFEYMRQQTTQQR